MATETATTPKITLDRSDGSSTMDLYRAALGPVRTDFYLKAFTRFDANGKAGPSWNWVAALLTVNWLLFRKLWVQALAYVGALAASLLLVFGIGRLVFQLSDSGQWAVLGLALLVSVGMPGAFGNTWLYSACTRRIEAALAACASTEEACALLAKDAGQRKRMGLLAGANLALAALVGGLALAWPDTESLPLHTSKMDEAREAGAASLPLMQSGLATQSVAAAASVQASAAVVPVSASAAPAASAPASASIVPAVAVQTATASVSLASASAPALAASHSAVGTPQPSRSSQGLVQTLPVAAPASAVVSAPAAMAKASASASSAPAPMEHQPAAVEEKPKPTPAERKAQAALEKKEKAAQLKAAKEAKAGKLKEVAEHAATASSRSASGKYLINVGLFADPNNARNAYAKLQDAGLSANLHELKSAKGPLTRVRVGPFDSEAEAERAAERIRALRLEAAVVKPE